MNLYNFLNNTKNNTKNNNKKIIDKNCSSKIRIFIRFIYLYLL